MSWLAKLIPFQWYFVGAALLGLAGWGASAEWRVHTAEAGEAKAISEKAVYVASAASAALAATTAARAEEQRRAAAQKEVVDDTIRKTAVVVADAAAAHDAADRLLQRVNALVASSRPAASNPAAAAPSASAAGPGLVLAKLLGSVDEAAGRYAALADERGIAGEACVRAYDSLTQER